MNKKLAHNMMYQLLYQGLVFLYPLLTTPIVSRAFGAEVLGVYSYTYSVAFYFSLVAGLGISIYGTRITSIYRDNRTELNKIFGEVYTIQFIAALVVLLIYGVAGIWMFGVNRISGLLQGIMIVTVLIDLSWFMTGMEEFRTMVIRNASIKICSLAFIYFLVKTPDDLNVYILIMTCTNLVGQISIWPLAMRHIEHFHFSFHSVRQHLIPSVKLLLPILAQNLYVLFDKVILEMQHSMSQVGYYENSEKIIRMPIGLANAACTVLLPKASYDVAQGGKEKNNQVVLKTLNIMLLLGVPMVMGLTCMSAELIPWYLGEDFDACRVTIPLMSPIIIFVSISTVLRTQYYIANKRDKEYTTSIVMTAFVNLVLNILLVGHYGIYGVIIGSVTSELLGMIYLMWAARKDLNYRGLVKPMLLYILASIPMGCVVRAVGLAMEARLTTTFMQVFSGAIMYMGIIGAFFLSKRYRRDVHV